MNINGISVRFCGDVHLPRCRGVGGVTNSFGSHEESGWRQERMWGERGGGGIDEEERDGERENGCGKGDRERDGSDEE